MQYVNEIYGRGFSPGPGLLVPDPPVFSFVRLQKGELLRCSSAMVEALARARTAQRVFESLAWPDGLLIGSAVGKEGMIKNLQPEGRVTL